MRWNHANVTAGHPSRQTLIGIFQTRTEASRALAAFHEHAFSAQQEELGNGPSEPEVKGTSGSGRGAGNWFGELRQIYNEDKVETSRPAHSDFGDRLVEYGISLDAAQLIARDAGPDGSILIVQPKDRWEEARSLLKKYGARIAEDQEIANDGTISDDARKTDAPNAAVAQAAPLPVTSAPRASHLVTPSATDSTGSTYNAPKSTQPIADPEPHVSPQIVTNSAPFEPPLPAEPGHIQLFGEELRIHKDKINSGDVRVRKESVTRMETVQVPVTREHLVVEHTDGSPMGHEGEIRIPLSEERLRIEKETRLHEEYKAGKREVAASESVTEPVRRERLLIDQPADDPQK